MYIILLIKSILWGIHMTNIQDMLKEFNHWWKNKFDINYEEREIYAKINKFMKYLQFIALTGLRRVGKTTLIFRIINNYGSSRI